MRLRVSETPPLEISQALFRKVLVAAYDLHRHRDAATFPAWLVRVLAQTVECDSALLVTIDPAAQTFETVAWPPESVAGLDPRDAWRLHAAHPCVQQFAASRSVRALRLSDLAPCAQFEQTELYRACYRPRGIEHQLLMLVAT